MPTATTTANDKKRWLNQEAALISNSRRISVASPRNRPQILQRRQFFYQRADRTPSLQALRTGVLLLIELPQQLGNPVGDLLVGHAGIKRL